MLSRRRFLAASALLGTSGTGLLAGCTDDGAPGVALADRDPLTVEPVALTGLRTPGTGEPVVVTVRASRITEVGTVAPADVPQVDLAGGWLVPGFIDCHVHMQFAAAADVLAGGVTTVRDLGGPPDAAQALRGSTPLRVLIAGRILTAVGGYPTTSWGADGTARQVTGPDDAVAAVQEQVLAGATVIKVALEDAGGLPVLDEATLAAIVAAAGDRGLRTTAHVGSSARLRQALDAGVRELAHLPLHDVTAAEMVAVAQAGVVVVPTLEIRGRDAGAAQDLRAFREAGGIVLYGSDLGNGGTAPGIERTEVELLLAAGMTPGEVLRAATSDAAAYLQLDTGRIEASAVADLVVLGGDPLADPAAYDDVRMVMASGQVVGGEMAGGS